MGGGIRVLAKIWLKVWVVEYSWLPVQRTDDRRQNQDKYTKNRYNSKNHFFGLRGH